MYRIWNKSFKMFAEDYLIKFDGTIWEFVSTDEGQEDYGYFIEVKKHKDNLVVQQCTGLKDKNGVLIYEGDGVNLTFFEPFSNECVTIDEECTIGGFVRYDNGGYFIQEEDSTWYYLGTIFDNATVEIIGNIMEDNNES